MFSERICIVLFASEVLAGRWILLGGGRDVLDDHSKDESRMKRFFEIRGNALSSSFLLDLVCRFKHVDIKLSVLWMSGALYVD